MLFIKVVQNLTKRLSLLGLGLGYLLLADSDFGFKARRLVLALFTSMLKLIFFSSTFSLRAFSCNCKIWFIVSMMNVFEL